MSKISRLKQSSLYLEEAVVIDPIFKLTDFRSSYTENLNCFMGLASIPMVNRQELAEAAIRLIELRPLVAGGFVKIYPVTFELERGEGVSFIYSEVGFEDCLPKLVLDKYKLNSVVRSVRVEDGRMLVMRDLYPCRNISVHFQGMESGFVMGYMLNPTKVKPTDKKNVYRFIQEMKSTPPSYENFAAWVNQSVNQTARNHFNELRNRVALCNYFGCMFSTEHYFESELLNMNVGISDIKSNTLNCTMQMDVPFLENVSSSDLMSIRNNDGEAFNAFRAELEKGLRDARSEKDPERVRTIIENTQHELFEVQMSQIAPQVKNIKKMHLAEAAIATAGIGFSVATGGASLLATLISGISACKSWSDYRSKVLSNPCHFIWKVKQKAKG
ncbi:hypothetical protein AB9R84_06355 [Oceanimonas smirnovii]|uniref:hypothetical protein n=1 Tax=Oceanimonas smirnovii TaxID=264574 RepID=UPI003AAB2EBE